MRRTEFESWTRLFKFHIEKGMNLTIHPQLWVNTITRLFNRGMTTDLGEGKL